MALLLKRRSPDPRDLYPCKLTDEFIRLISPNSSCDKYGYDYMGYFKVSADYYRANGRVPSGTTWAQDMTIVCGQTPVIYRTNPFSAGIEPVTVWVSRDGVLETRAY